VACPDGSAFDGLCDPTTGDPVEVPEATTVTSIDFQLTPDRGRIFADGFESGDVSAWAAVMGGG